MSNIKRADESSEGQEIVLSVGDKLELSLDENPTTGFQWQLTAKGEPVCELESDSFLEPSSSLVGRGGEHRWRFKAARPGQGEIKLLYRRPWEQEGAAARTYTLYVRVSK